MASLYFLGGAAAPGLQGFAWGDRDPRRRPNAAAVRRGRIGSGTVAPRGVKQGGMLLGFGSRGGGKPGRRTQEVEEVEGGKRVRWRRLGFRRGRPGRRCRLEREEREGRSSGIPLSSQPGTVSASASAYFRKYDFLY